MSARKCSRWRKSAFAKLVDRDGARCSHCQIPGRTIWRQFGVWGSSEEGGCYTKVHPTSNLEVDHRDALHVGGDNDLDNLWLLCRDCHQRKTSMEQSQRLKRLFAEARV